MKRFHPLLCLLAAGCVAPPAVPARAPVPAALVVQNHASDDFQIPLAKIGDALKSQLAGTVFTVKDPNAVFGKRQDRGVWGEKLPESSAIRLSEQAGADVLLAAAVDEATVVNVGNPVQFQRVLISMTLSAARIPSGDIVASVTETAESRQTTPALLFANRDERIYEACTNAVARVSRKLLEKCKDIDWKDEGVRPVEVAFESNIPGADVQIDGVSYGTIDSKPLRLRISPGVHSLRIEANALGLAPFVRTAMIQGDQTWTYVARENEEGRKLRVEDKKFDELLKHLEQGRATDNEVKLLVAHGYAKYLSSSHTRLDGMPQSLDTEGLGLGPNLDLSGGSSTNGALEAVRDFDPER